jgi:hypothetical protein
MASVTTTNQASELYSEEMNRGHVVSTIKGKHTPKLINPEPRKAVGSPGVPSTYGFNQSRQI